MRYPARLTGKALILGSSLLCASQMTAQDAATTDEDVVYLSPFEVTSEGSIGYQARDTLAGTRLRTDLKDVANAIQVVNSKFLQDTGATDTKSLLVYTTNTEVGGIGGNFSNQGGNNVPDDEANRVSPQTNTRVRGLTSADNTRNFFLTRIPWDAYNSDRIDIQRGANSILFGIGSPAGIINVNIPGASMFNEGKVEARIGSYGSIRGSVNVNRVLIDGQLAVRVAGLYNDEQYRQDPAFSRDERIFVAARYDPKWAKIGSSVLSIKTNYEHGDIEANRPRIAAPIDRITPWYTSLNKGTYDSMTANVATGDTTDGGYAGTGELIQDDPNWLPHLAYWGDSNSFCGPVAIYNSATSPTQNYIDSGNAWNYTNNPGNGSEIPDGHDFGIGILNQSTYASAVGLPGSGIGAWKVTTLSDPNIFNFYKNLLDGDAKRENEEWDAFNLTASETFMDGLAGVELAYDYQQDTQTYHSRIAGSAYAISVDVSETMSDGSVNPNLGRAFIASRSYGYSNTQMNNTLRGTAFVDVDLKKYMDPDSLLVRLIGRNVFQANITHASVNSQTLGWKGTAVPSSGPYGKYIELSQLSYLSGDLRGTTLGQNLGISRIQAARDPVDGSMSLLDNPAGVYRNYPTQVFSDTNKEDMSNLYSAGGSYDTRTITDSWATIWNGYLLDNIIVPTVCYRNDKQTSGTTGGATTNAIDGIANFDKTYWYVPTSADDVTNSNQHYSRTDGNSTSWGVVARLPEYVKNKLPFGMDFSVFYNKSDNFQPMSSRVDIYYNPLPSPKGETKDYGFAISALENRFSLKVNWYDTTITDADVSAAITNLYMLGAGEDWAMQYMLDYAFHLNGVENQLTDPTLGYSPWQPESANMTDEQILAKWEACRDAWFTTDANGVPTGLTSNVPNVAFQKAWLNSGYTFQQEFDEVKSGAVTQPSSEFNQYIKYGDGNMTVTGDVESKGVEFELYAQITKNWNLSLNAAKTTATRTNLGGSYAEFSEERAAMYAGPYGDVRIWADDGSYSAGNVLRAKWMSEYYGNYRFQRALEGSDVPELCKWRLNLVSNYEFDEGMLKGTNIGVGYRWQDSVVIGYPIIADTAGDYSYDITKPWMGPTEQYFDLWIGYQHAINDDVTWRIQLNVRNVGAGDKLIPITINPADKNGDGVYESYSTATARIADAMSWTITNTFSF